MTREDAISIMNVIVHMLEEKYDTDRVEEAVDMAIEALEQEPCEDCISRKDAINVIKRTVSTEQIKELKRLPSVQPVACIGKVEFDEEKLKDIVHETIENYSRPKGKWMRMIADDDDYILPRYRCYKCGFIVAESDRSNFCPNCGADMRGTE